MSNHCCTKIEGVLEENSTPLRYVPYTRSYYIEYFPTEEQNTDYILVAERILFCPWCGTCLPRSLLSEWVQIIERKFGITDTLDKKQLEKIPKKYLSEEWWKEEYHDK